MADKRLIAFARDLRRQCSDAERRMWSYLRQERLGGHSFRRQHPMGQYIADFYCHAARLVVELDGEQYAVPRAIVYDEKRSAAMGTQGIAVLRFTTAEAMKDSDAVARTILREVERRLAELSRPPP